MRGGVAALLCLGLVACGGTGSQRPPTGSSATSSVAAVLDLPPPSTAGGTSLEQALSSRRSVRDFTDVPLTTEELGQLLWAAQGITASWGGRTAPSAGALYPLEIYAVTGQALYHYLPEGHRVEVVGRADLRAPLAAAALGQAPVADAAVVLVVTGVVARTEAKYGARAERYVQLEAGHAAQNVLLQAVSLDLGAVPIGAFQDEAVAAVLALPPDRTPFYLICLGHPAASS
ncbi:MAG TPA: SagB/ThcOx family dehydrogenase [Actinomycetota bacterium]